MSSLLPVIAGVGAEFAVARHFNVPTKTLAYILVAGVAASIAVTVILAAVDVGAKDAP